MTKMCGAGRLFFLLIAFLAITPTLPAFAASTEYRALWVDVFHPGLRSKAEADAMIATARRGGYNAIIVQVRKACDAFYNSSVEPKNSSVEQGFDPLGYIIQQAHSGGTGQQRLEVDAWVVTYRVRMPGETSWQNPNHVFHRHPEWLMENDRGHKEGSGENSGKYYLDPGVPQVIDYNLNMVRDMLSHYDVDGIVFDYIRYPESSSSGNEWGYNPVSIARFNHLYGRTGKPARDDPQFNDFRREQVYDQVRKVYAHVRAWRPRVKIGAATIAWGNYNGNFENTDAYGSIMQDWPRMANDGFLDLILPMNYKREQVPDQARAHREWAQFLAQVAQQSGRFGVNIVDGEELNTLDGILAQARDTRNIPGLAGIATYCYAEPRKGAGSRPTPDLPFFDAIRSNLFPGLASIPDATWLSHPTQGLVKGIVTRNGKPADGAIVRLGRQSTRTDGTGFYAFAHVLPGEQEIQASDGTGVIGTAHSNVQPGGVAEAPIAG
jgi:uncharacterized lipoprotein YddW (UPF0748 family)